MLVLNTQQAAQVLGVTDRQIRKMAAKGTIPSIRMGKLIKIPVSELAKQLGVTVEDIEKVVGQ